MSANSRHYRFKAAQSAQHAAECKSPSEVKVYREAERSYSDLAENEEWVEANRGKLVER